MLEYIMMVKKLLAIIFLSLLVFSLSVELYIDWKRPVPPPKFAKSILFYYYLPWYLEAVDYVSKAEKNDNGYWVMRTLEEVEEAIKRAPTNGVLWFWAAKLRKFLGMRYKEFMFIAFKLDPYRLKYNETLKFLTAEDLVKNTWIINKMIELNKSGNFFRRIAEKLWNSKDGEKFLLNWIPYSSVNKGRLAKFLIDHNKVGRGLYLLLLVRETGDKLYLPALGSLLNLASKMDKQGKIKEEQWILKKVFELDPLYDNLAVKLADFYLRQKEDKEVNKIVTFYKDNYPEYVVTERLQKFLKKWKVK